MVVLENALPALEYQYRAFDRSPSFPVNDSVQPESPIGVVFLHDLMGVVPPPAPTQVQRLFQVLTHCYVFTSLQSTVRNQPGTVYY